MSITGNRGETFELTGLLSIQRVKAGTIDRSTGGGDNFLSTKKGGEEFFPTKVSENPALPGMVPKC